MSELQNDIFLKALSRQSVERTPVWVMRQAGRYLPEYRATRAKAGDFLSLCSNPDLACEVTLQPLRRFELDAAILFSDILTVPDAMGLGLYFEQGEGPKFKTPIRKLSQIKQLPNPDPENELRYVMDAVRTIRRELNGKVPLIGFTGSPWTLATYMIEGGSSKEYAFVKGMLFDNPIALHMLLNKVTQVVINYLNAQVAAGAQALMVFDTWGGALSPANYIEFSLQYMQKIVEGVIRSNEGRHVPIVLFTKNGGQWLDKIANTGCDGVGVDWTTDLSTARSLTQNRVAIQGNLDPCVLYAHPTKIREEVAKVLQSYGKGTGHVFNLGHGIHQHVNPENLKAMVDTVRELSPQYHQ